MARKVDLTSLWMVPYADLMSTMVILFLALFAYSYGEKKPEYERALAHMQQEVDSSQFAQVRAQESDLAVRVKQEMNQLALRDFGLRVTSSHIHLLLPAPVLFPEGSATLNPGADRILDPLARLFADLPNPILVQGHTDNTPVHPHSQFRNNWELSAARAFSVGEYFMKRGLAPDRFNARGYSEYRPVDSNATADGRGRNRRIEISIVRDIRKDS
jgi:chemotaxis protein MotB